MKDFAELAQSLKTKGIGSYFQRADQLVISNSNPTLPSSNSFWVTQKNDGWYIATWLPAVYAVPDGQKVEDVCEVIFHSSPKAIYTVEEVIESKFKLRRLTNEEIEAAGF